MIDVPASTAALLTISLVVSALSQGRWSNAWAGMALPGLLVVTAHNQEGWMGPALVGLVYALASYPAWRGLLPGHRWVVFGICVGSGFFVGLALAVALFAADLLVWAGPLVLVLILEGSELAGAHKSPTGEWGLSAHSQARHPWARAVGRRGPHAVSAVLTLVSGTAGFGVAYGSPSLLILAAAAIAFLWLVGRRLRHTAAAPPPRAVGLHEDDPHFFAHHVSYFVGDEPISDSWRAKFRKRADVQHRNLLNRTRRAGRDADLVIWSEGAGLVDSADFSAAQATTAEAARQGGSYVVASWLVLDMGARKMDNVATVFDPTGALVLTQRKLLPVIGPEAERTAAHGHQPPAAVDTPFGRLAVVICFDADHAATWHRVAVSKADVVAIPASDWPAIGRLHADMAILRSQSVGASIIRPARHGISVVTNSHGTVLHEVDHRHSNGPDLTTTH